MNKKMLLIDGSSLIFRAFFAIRNLTTKDGIHTNGVYGFLNMYKRALELIEPDYIAVAFDKAGPTFRNKDYEAYKGTRDKTPPELSAQFGMLKDILDSLNVVHLDSHDYEADDILGTLSKKVGKDGIESYLLTGDRDYFQLVDDHSKVLYTKKGITELEIYDIKKIKDRYDLKPEDLIEVKGLMGDTSDNIPGVPGVGEKTAIKLVKEYGTMEEIYDNIDSISGKKLKENLINNKEIAFLSRKLGRIYTEVPIEKDLEDFSRKEPDVEALYEKFKKLEFNSFMNMFKSREDVEIESDVEILRAEKFDDLLEDIKEKKELFFEFFIDDENYIREDIDFMAIASRDSGVLLIDYKKDREKIYPGLKKIFEDESIRKVSFDVKKSIFLLDKEKISLEKNYIDLLVLSYLIDPSRTKYQIADLADQYLERTIMSEEDLLGKGKSKKLYKDLNLKELEAYVANYMDSLRQSTPILLEEIEKLGMHELYFTIELPLINVLARMEIRGVKVDRRVLEEINTEISTEIDRLKETIYSLAESEFNINSPKQLGEILFDKLGLPVIKKTKTGYSTDAEVLDKLKSSHEIIDHILRYRELSKLQSTYIQGMYPYINEDGRIRSIFRQTIAATGRLSSTEPNLQNIPIKTEEGRLIRKAFISDDDKKLLSADYSQIELRVLAALSKDDNMLEAFRQGVDIHRKTASEVFHVGLDEVTKLQRSEAKAVNFGIVYGISDYGLSRNLNIARKTAKSYIDKYLDSYPKISEYMDRIVEETKKLGYVETIFHRRRYVPEINSKNFTIRSQAERITLNTPIQGSAADIIKVAMVKVYDRLKKEKLKSQIILQIHDELILETYEDELNEVKNILKEEMESAVKLEVDLIAEVESGDNWYEV
ncbi:MAG: DNA polymerase I [Tissierellia bacterium]|nr:DNA polymerase I [Tissierellia bacterium]